MHFWKIISWRCLRAGSTQLRTNLQHDIWEKISVGDNRDVHFFSHIIMFYLLIYFFKKLTYLHYSGLNQIKVSWSLLRRLAMWAPAWIFCIYVLFTFVYIYSASLSSHSISIYWQSCKSQMRFVCLSSS